MELPADFSIETLRGKYITPQIVGKGLARKIVWIQKPLSSELPPESLEATIQTIKHLLEKANLKDLENLTFQKKVLTFLKEKAIDHAKTHLLFKIFEPISTWWIGLKFAKAFQIIESQQKKILAEKLTIETPPNPALIEAKKNSLEPLSPISSPEQSIVPTQNSPPLKQQKSSLKQKMEEILKLASESPNGKIIEEWRNFNLDKKSSTELLLKIAETNPTILFEKWRSLPEIDRASREHLRAKVPFFSLQEKITRLNSDSTLSFAKHRSEIRTLLQELHILNQKCGIPFDLYRIPDENESRLSNLATLIAKIAKTSTSNELLSLVKDFNENYFFGTNPLLHTIYLEAKSRFPSLQGLMTGMVAGYWPAFSPFLTPKGANQLIVEKLKKKGLDQSVDHPPAFRIKDLAAQVARFHDSPSQKALFLIYSGAEGTAEHYTPLIMEKERGIIKILNSDSVSAGTHSYTKTIVETLQSLPFKMEIYVTTDARQTDSFSCAVFAVGDIKKAAKIMSQGSKSFFDYLKSQASLGSDSEGGIQQITTLPVGMMTMTQSLSRVQKVAFTSPTFMRKGLQMELTEYVRHHTYFRYDYVKQEYKKSNMLAPMKAARYFQHILEQTIQKMS